MGRITARRPVTRIRIGQDPRRRPDTLAVEEPLEIRVGGDPLSVTMRTPGHDVELATGFLLSEGIVRTGADVQQAIHCGGPATGGQENTYNVLDVTLAPGVAAPTPDMARNVYMTSSCGVCGKASIDAVRTESAHPVADDPLIVDAALLTTFPDVLREHQAAFEKTGGLHAAALFDGSTGELLVVREDVGRHNAVDKVVGWAAMNDRLPLAGCVLMVSGRVAFELAQKSIMAGAPMIAAVSAPSSLAVDLADEAGLTLVGFLRGESMNVYAGERRVRASSPADRQPAHETMDA
ncbi:formate dehydrogenase accessory sulfurtransferase FdhD [Microbacterium sp. G2-8]|uniref:formate dehydrogenase accessory sulfurtransferase FdhD n=1 Tax=Microbacterium sp. G2-8 TaxID=2842454 RepID=UPI001C8A651F|nr:formate dehydrogenase accessory sulfurtransferase FdhD [Microbacterium sp. G2-8]